MDNLGFDGLDEELENLDNGIEDFDDDKFSDNIDDEISDDELAELDDFDDLEEVPSVPVDEPDDANIEDGALVDDLDLHDDEVYEETMPDYRDGDFISSTGDITVQDTNDSRELGFELEYVDIDKIAITPRIRKPKSVEGLVQSIKSTGLLKPIVVSRTSTEGLFVLLDGYRRLQACARAGKTKIPCIVNTLVRTTEIPIIEALYNHSQRYTIKEQVDYIDYLEKEKGMMNPAMIEYLLQMNSGDYTKLKDILNDNDDDIVSKLYDGSYDIATAFRKLEQRRKKESMEEKENKKAARVYDDEKESGADQIQGSGEESEGNMLTDEQIRSLEFSQDELDDAENQDLSEMVADDSELKGFEAHKQKVGEREYIDPAIKKAALARDNFTCQCCKRGGEQYVDVLDYHHVLPVFLGGRDELANGVMLCVTCHRLVHLYSTGDLHIDEALYKDNFEDLTEDEKSRYENPELFEDEKNRFKRIIVFGSKIRKGIVAQGMNREQYKKEHPNTNIGRRKPGVAGKQEEA